MQEDLPSKRNLLLLILLAVMMLVTAVLAVILLKKTVSLRSETKSSLSSALGAPVYEMRLARVGGDDHRRLIEKNNLILLPVTIKLTERRQCFGQLLLGGRYKGKNINFLVNEGLEGAYMYIKDEEELQALLKNRTTKDIIAAVLLGRPDVNEDLFPDLELRKGYLEYAKDFGPTLSKVATIMKLGRMGLWLPSACGVFGSVNLPVVSLEIPEI